MTTQCKLCGKDINPHDASSWKEITGFVGGPKKDSMVLRTDTGKFACGPCIHKAKVGQAPEQNSLFDNVPVVRPAPVSEEDLGPE
jgi:hypothetical protein